MRKFFIFFSFFFSFLFFDFISFASSLPSSPEYGEFVYFDYAFNNFYRVDPSSSFSASLSFNTSGSLVSSSALSLTGVFSPDSKLILSYNPNDAYAPYFSDFVDSSGSNDIVKLNRYYNTAYFYTNNILSDAYDVYLYCISSSGLIVASTSISPSTSTHCSPVIGYNLDGGDIVLSSSGAFSLKLSSSSSGSFTFSSPIPFDDGLCYYACSLVFDFSSYVPRDTFVKLHPVTFLINGVYYSPIFYYNSIDDAVFYNPGRFSVVFYFAVPSPVDRYNSVNGSLSFLIEHVYGYDFLFSDSPSLSLDSSNNSLSDSFSSYESESAKVDSFSSSYISSFEPVNFVAFLSQLPEVAQVGLLFINFWNSLGFWRYIIEFGFLLSLLSLVIGFVKYKTPSSSKSHSS